MYPEEFVSGNPQVYIGSLFPTIAGEYSTFCGEIDGIRLSNVVRTSFSPYGGFALITSEPTAALGDTISPPITGTPDLAVLNLTSYPDDSGGILVEAVVQNQGDVQTENGFFTDLYADHEPTGVGDYTGSIRFWVNDPIAAGSKVTLTTVITEMSGLFGMGWQSLASTTQVSGVLYTQVDSTGAVDESNETNNISSGTEVCIAGADEYESDDTVETATLLNPDAAQIHNFHAPGDQDWFRLEAEANIYYVIATSDLDVSSDTYLYLYDTDGSTLLVANDDHDGSLASQIGWMVSNAGTYYVLVRHWNPTAGGCGTTYRVSVNQGTAPPTPVPTEPDLIPFTPSGYEYPITPSSVAGTAVVDTLRAGQPTYFDWWFTNRGGTAAGDFYVDIWVDDIRYAHYLYSNFEHDWIGGFADWEEIIANSGLHTVRIVIDPDNTIIEIDEDNNTWQGQFYWESPSFPSLDLVTTVPNPLQPWHIRADVTWCDAQETWQILDWGDGSETGLFGSCGTQTRTHDYAEGSYATIFSVVGLDGNIYTESDAVDVVIGCDADVTLDGVVAFDGQDCVGPYEQFLDLGPYNLTSLDDQTSSIHIPDGMSVMLYEDLDGGGQGFCTGWDMWNMAIDTWPDGSPMNNTISSIEVFDNATCSSAGIAPTLELTTTIPNPLQPWHIRADVIWCDARDTWQILDWGDGSETGLFGACGSETRTHDYAEGSYTTVFNVVGLNGNTYTDSDAVDIVIGCGADVTLGGVVTFDGQDCIGSYEQLLGLGPYNLTALNDQTSSIHIPDGMSVMLYEDLDQGGQGFCTGWDMWNMAIDTWPDGSPMNNTISSIEVFDNATCSSAGIAPILELTTTIPNPLQPWHIRADVTWCDAQDTWQVLDWGDGSETGLLGSCGTETRTHDYAEGSYITIFSVVGLDGNIYTESDAVDVVIGCGADVTLDGVVAFDGQDCVGPYEQFLNLGPYNLTSLDDQTSSIHIPDGMSVMLYEELEGGGQGFCTGWDMWNMAIDTWPDGSPMDNTISSIEVFANATCSSAGIAPSLGLTTTIPNPLQPWHIRADMTWCDAQDAWQILEWGDDSETGLFGACGSDTRIHDFAEGSYSMLFNVVGLDGSIYTTSDIIDVVIGCDADVVLDGVVAFDGQDCVGSYEQLLGLGPYNLTTLNDQTSSIHIPDGMSVMLYEDLDEGGQGFCTGWDMWNMAIDTWPDGSPMNNTISSIEVFDNSSCGDNGEIVATIFTEDGLLGLGHSNAVGQDNIPYDVAEEASSLSMNGGSVMLYQYAFQTGRSVCFSSDDVDLSDNTFGDGMPLDNIVSVEVFSGQDCGRIPRVYLPLVLRSSP
jgi:hypothetical protein